MCPVCDSTVDTLQVNLYQRSSFFHQLTQNMRRCFWGFYSNRTCCELILFKIQANSDQIFPKKYIVIFWVN